MGKDIRKEGWLQSNCLYTWSREVGFRFRIHSVVGGGRKVHKRNDEMIERLRKNLVVRFGRKEIHWRTCLCFLSYISGIIYAILIFIDFHLRIQRTWATLVFLQAQWLSIEQGHLPRISRITIMDVSIFACLIEYISDFFGVKTEKLTVWRLTRIDY